ncbi:MAG: COX15/CtaA family protein [Sphingomonas sp.]|jgi:cytochrome c oxidase assembly protein subunit 15|uniref:COX15/CtaA family protein n=1 Tax=unclassified Sphingomonas TaxID=196159 RepID=UPI000AB38217|nr:MULTISPECIES: COX15/CtaA family protein [unclassified Sphingomonas]MDR6847079.1 cytochrome c oxidase assembly protein subunit 15 [Sphingomonas sp. BE137]MDR7256680.1 cytochrome c oxidase assembly protein subunit 15 [Sphingomonas sp. BE270]
MLQASSLPQQLRPRTLSNWLFGVAALVVAMVVIGGITRLTESGLSITQWKPISGVIPPLNAVQWQAEFDNYKKIPEYQQLNRGMSMAGFQAIFFWEYLHRLLGRVVGAAYLLPLLWFWIRGRVPRGYVPRLFALVALVCFQGAIGWWMVSSGLVKRTDVSHVRLAVHLVTALTLLAGTVWTALDLRALALNGRARPARLRPVAVLALGLLFGQILFGAFTAGLDAGYAFSSWPLMGDEIFPAATPLTDPLWRNAVDNPVVVQFIHRWFAFVAAAGLVTLALGTMRAGAPRTAAILIGLVACQIVLGIATLLSGVEIVVAVAHQANAALTLIAATAAAHAVGRRFA